MCSLDAVRTNIEIDDDLLAEAQAVAGTDTKRATVEYALRELVRRRKRLEILDLEGTGWEGDLEWMRDDPPVEPFPDDLQFPDVG
jgi:Arc/MetJ family transcription regulator